MRSIIPHFWNSGSVRSLEMYPLELRSSYSIKWSKEESCLGDGIVVLTYIDTHIMLGILYKAGPCFPIHLHFQFLISNLPS